MPLNEFLLEATFAEQKLVNFAFFRITHNF